MKDMPVVSGVEVRRYLTASERELWDTEVRPLKAALAVERVLRELVVDRRLRDLSRVEGVA